MVLVVDNYDSFTYNLVQYLGELGAEVSVMRNDAVALEAIAKAPPERIVISPGPGRPEEAGVTMALIRHPGRARRSWASVWDIRRSAPSLAAPSCAHRCRCTA